MKKLGAIFLILIQLLTFSCSKKNTSQKHIENTIQNNVNNKSIHGVPEITEESIIKFSEDIYDFKDIKKGEKVTHVFKFTNIGKRPLVISEVRPSCGCTTPKYTKEPIYPGKKGEITVTFDSSNFEGQVVKIIAISGNFKTKLIKFQARVN